MTATLLLTSTNAVARTWYLAPFGDDGGDGTKQAPLATWQRAIDQAKPGDTILVAAGTYPVTNGRGVSILHGGRSGGVITFRSIGGRAMLDCSKVRSGAGMACLHLQANWWVLDKVDVSGARQGSPGSWSVGILIEDASNNVLNQVASYENEGTGILITGASSNNHLINCDSYRNFDRLTRPVGSDADGIGVKFIPPSAVGNEIIGCRTWANSDDGIDLWFAEAPVKIRSSWSFWNGYIPGSSKPAGDGVGFKFGRNKTGPRHQISASLSLENRYAGFDSNLASGPIDVVRNIAIDNGLVGFNFPENGHRLRGLATYGNPVWAGEPAPVDATMISPSTARCIMRSPAIGGPRGVDGSLPPLDCG